MTEIWTALDRLQTLVPDPVARTVPVWEAEGMVLAAPVVAHEPVPPWPRAAMDGFAVRAADIRHASPDRPIRLCVVGEAVPGHPFSGQVATGQAVAIATGAPVPPGADAIVRWEEVNGPEDGYARFRSPVAAGRHLSLPGEDLPGGMTALSRGTVIGPLEAGVLAMLGRTWVEVVRPPAVAILCTGDELIEAPRPRAYGQVYNAGGPLLAALVRQAGGVPVSLGTVGDDPGAIARRIKDAVAGSALLLTTGGVSRGISDRVPEAAARLGAGVLFNRLSLKPGAACLGAVLGERAWVALSGNPAAAVTQFDLLVRPLIARAAGRQDTRLIPLHVRLASAVEKTSPLRRCLRATFFWHGAELAADVALAQQATVLSSLARAQGYVELPPGARLSAGDMVRAWLRPGSMPAICTAEPWAAVGEVTAGD